MENKVHFTVYVILHMTVLVYMYAKSVYNYIITL